MCNNNERIFPIFRHFNHFAPCTIQWAKNSNFVFLTSELKSAHNFSVENMFYSYFWDTSYFHTFGSQVGVRSQTLSYIVLFCLFVSSATWDTQSETIHVASVYNFICFHGTLPISPPDNQQKWGVWVPLLRTLLCMLRDEVLQIK